MARFLHPEYYPSFRKYGYLFLALSGIAGFAAGLFLFSSGSFPDSSLMYAVLDCRVSIVDLLIPFLLPFSVSACAVYMNYPQVLPGICFVKSALHGFVSCLINGSFGTAGWIIRLLTMFSGILHLILLYWYWCRHILGDRSFSVSETVSFLCMAVLSSGVDHFFVIPVLGDIFSF